MTKINLGSGPSSAKGWKNYDWGLLPFLGKYRFLSILVKLGLLDKNYDLRWPDIEMVDIRNVLPDRDKSVDFIYCSHVLEHFEKYESIKILKECRRVLKRRGLIRVVLPNLYRIVEDYSGADKFNRVFFGFDKDRYNGFLGSIKKFFIRGHQWMYDIDSAKLLLKDAGFKRIKLCSFQKGMVPDIDKLDLEQHKNISLYLEAGNRL